VKRTNEEGHNNNTNARHAVVNPDKSLQDDAVIVACKYMSFSPEAVKG
jgi:hypothetical protein